MAASTPDSPRYADELAEEIEDLDHQATQPAWDADPSCFLDRENSWLDYGARLLDLAADEAAPVLERVRFLAILSGALDEFFMVRVAGLHQRLEMGLGSPVTPAGLSAREQLDLVATRTHQLTARQSAIFTDAVLPALVDNGVHFTTYAEVGASTRDDLERYFDEHLYPVLTPLAVDPAHPFPYISGLSLNLAVVVRDSEDRQEHFARVKIPPLLPRFVPVGSGSFVLLEDLIRAHLPDLFPGLQIVESSVFRVTRNEDVSLEETEVDNLLQALERELSRRRFGPAVRLEVDAGTSEDVLRMLVRELEISDAQLYRVDGPLDLRPLWDIAELDRPALKYPPLPQLAHPRLRARANAKEPPDIFQLLREGDLLVHHPYDSFASSVQSFVEQAASDPAVLAIKQTLYRTSGDSPLVDALIGAAEAGKQVLVVVEIKARFDERANIRWARALERAGCHVVYGLVCLKTHCKVALVVRQEPDGTLRRYAHVGTGNYNPKTARIYEDFGLLTADPEIGADIADLFNHLSGYTKQHDYRSLLVAPDTLRSGLLRMIENEASNALAGRPSGIVIKVNNLVDEQIVNALYSASAAGVQVELIVRGMCTLRPGVPGLSEHIRVRSIIGRLLEHSRVMWFVNGGEEQLWLGSADAMHRNLDRRVEALVRVRDAAARARLREVLQLATDPRTAAWTLRADGSWVRQTADADGAPLADLQQTLLARALVRGDETEPSAEAGSSPLTMA